MTVATAPEMIEKLLDREGKHVEEVTQQVKKDAKLLKLVLEGATSTNEAYRYNCSKALSRISE